MTVDEMIAEMSRWCAEQDRLYEIANETDAQEDWDVADEWEETARQMFDRFIARHQVNTITNR